ncbi:MAG: sodium:solute symporter family protein [Firmicutes bacterium]|nr:sodium:solute symporter family protein [Bacillota bacterium]
MSQSNIAVFIIFIFAFTPLILAEVARKNAIATIEDFFIYSRRMPLFYAFCTIFATWYSAFAVMGSASSFYQNGPVYMTCFAWNALFAVGIYFIGRRIWFYGKKRGYITPSDFFQDMYGSSKVTILVTIIGFVFTVPYLQIQMFGGSYLLEVATNGAIPWKMTVLVFYVIMIVYLWAGGIRSVALTDIFYSGLVFFVLLFTGIFLINKAGGVDTVFDYLTQADSEHVIVSGSDPAHNVLLWLTMFVVTPIGALMGPPMWIRHYSIKEKKSFYILPLLIAAATMCYFGSIFAGNAGKILVPDITNTEILVPNMIIHYGGTILATILLCGFFAAALSTANSQIHALSAIYTIDIHRRYINPNASDARLIYITKWVLMLISLATYIMIIRQQSIILDTGLLALSGTAQLIVPTLGAFFWKRSSGNGAFAGMLVGVLLLLTLRFMAGFEASLSGCIALGANAVIFIIVSLSGESNIRIREKIVDFRMDYEEKMK